MMRRLLIIALVALSLTGCFKQVRHKYAYENWRKPGVSDDEVKRAILECGYSSPFGGEYPMDDNSIALSNRCMNKNGFIHEGYLMKKYGKTFCEEYPQIPACRLPLDQVPDRHVVKRLNSPFCKEFPQATVCQP